MNLRPLLIPPLAVLALVTVRALAQAPAAGDATTTAAPLPAVPAANCVAPEFPGKRASNTQITAFNKEYKAYNECIRKYVEANRSLARALEEASNKTIDEYNKYTENLKKEVDAAKE